MSTMKERYILLLLMILGAIRVEAQLNLNDFVNSEEPDSCSVETEQSTPTLSAEQTAVDSLQARINLLEQELGEATAQTNSLQARLNSIKTQTYDLKNRYMHFQDTVIYLSTSFLTDSSLTKLVNKLSCGIVAAVESDSIKSGFSRAIGLLGSYENHTKELYQYLKASNRQLGDISERRSKLEMKNQLRTLDVYKDYNRLPNMRDTTIGALLIEIEAQIDNIGNEPIQGYFDPQIAKIRNLNPDIDR